jgi:ATP synthase protein I
LAEPLAKGAAPDGIARRQGQGFRATLRDAGGEAMPVDGNGQDPIGDEGPVKDVRLNQLDARLKAAAQAETIRSGTTKRKPDGGYSQGSRVLAELIAGPVGGGLIGWLLDRWFGSSPWLLLAFVILGFAAAIWNIVKISSRRPE